jgi:uncharacterized protein (UPF0305 family)
VKASTLYLIIKKGLETLSTYKFHIEQKLSEEDTGSISSIMAKYNYDTLVEILSRKCLDPDFEIDDKRLKDFQHRIDYYLDTYAPDDSDLKTYITGISTYLAFIAKRPLHPPGLEFDNGFRIVKKGSSYYCDGKKQFIKEDQSLCKYCICKQLSWRSRYRKSPSRC